MKKSIIIFTAAIMFMALNQESFSQRKEHRNFEVGKANLIERLNLTNQQKEKFESLRFSYQETMIKLKSELELQELEIKKIQSSEKISRNDLIKAVQEINQIKNKIALADVNHEMDIYELLDDSQKKIWSERPMIDHERRERIKDRFRDEIKEKMRNRLE